MNLLFFKQCFNLVFQVKPLLQVTKQEEKLSAKEDELRQVREKMEKAEVEVSELEKKLQQVKLCFNKFPHVILSLLVKLFLILADFFFFFI